MINTRITEGGRTLTGQLVEIEVVVGTTHLEAPRELTLERGTQAETLSTTEEETMVAIII
jgi:hypothetical protein